MENEPLLTTALEYAKIGLPVFPLAKLSKVPLKNTSGFKQATTDEEQIFEWFTEIEPIANVGISLVDTPYFVIDIDDHDGTQSGMKSLMTLSNGSSLPDNVVIIRTPNNGIHCYFKAPAGIEIKQQIGFKPGLDCIKNFVVGPGSRVKRQDGTVGTYEVINGSLDSIGEAPAFILNAITSNQQPKESSEVYTLDYSSSGNTKKYTAVLIEEIVQGVNESERNVWVTRVTGKLLRLGMSSKEAYEFLLVVNENFVRPPLPDKEVNTIFKSILKAESNKRKGVAT
ncbi:bifunctional DNA primase/polymerase [Desemzia incerta]|uniref:bifunctional DNA primase/polymerase n=1 Tax=Desemzia incerta TaxID=82801 RepID=UPI0016614D5D|nr:bifunctional DNA primase/polymerase [Desemzia incerta]